MKPFTCPACNHILSWIDRTKLWGINPIKTETMFCPNCNARIKFNKIAIGINFLVMIWIATQIFDMFYHIDFFQRFLSLLLALTGLFLFFFIKLEFAVDEKKS